MTLSTCIPFRHRARATYSLPGDVIEVRQNVAATTPTGQRKRLATGLYVVVSQRGNALVLSRAGEDEDEQIVADGPPYGIPVHILETEAVRATYIRAAY